MRTKPSVSRLLLCDDTRAYLNCRLYSSPSEVRLLKRFRCSRSAIHNRPLMSACAGHKRQGRKADGDCHLIALKPSPGHNPCWSLRLLADRMVELAVDAVSYETVRRAENELKPGRSQHCPSRTASLWPGWSNVLDAGLTNVYGRIASAIRETRLPLAAGPGRFVHAFDQSRRRTGHFLNDIARYPCAKRSL